MVEAHRWLVNTPGRRIVEVSVLIGSGGRLEIVEVYNVLRRRHEP